MAASANTTRRGVAFRNGTLFNAVDRLTGFAIQDVHQRVLVDHGHRRNRPTALDDVEQAGRGGKIGIPQIVMDQLEMPLILTGGGVDGDKRVRV